MEWSRLVFVLLIAAASVARGQAPAFDVASVKPSGPDSPAMSLQQQPGGRLVTSNTPLIFLVGWAYSVEDGRLFGAPPGADSARFDIVGQPPARQLLKSPPESADANPFSMTAAGLLGDAA